ncbi:hypothetical protein P9222_22990 [Paenibacillus amylolyticus]|nr:hypothetical protein [Paenibacillus amylolyticus]WFR61309.1 hypothetical protein P9222_22990 [Paenibacillus amylolyticus]
MTHIVHAAAEDIRSEDSLQLIKELSEELGLLYGGDGTAGFQLSDVEVPRAAFIVARIDGHPVGCGALRPLMKHLWKSNACIHAAVTAGRGLLRRFWLKRSVLRTNWVILI